jgi:hypothetical protein
MSASSFNCIYDNSAKWNGSPNDSDCPTQEFQYELMNNQYDFDIVPKFFYFILVFVGLLTLPNILRLFSCDLNYRNLYYGNYQNQQLNSIAHKIGIERKILNRDAPYCSDINNLTDQNDILMKETCRNHHLFESLLYGQSIHTIPKKFNKPIYSKYAPLEIVIDNPVDESFFSNQDKLLLKLNISGMISKIAL